MHVISPNPLEILRNDGVQEDTVLENQFIEFLGAIPTQIPRLLMTNACQQGNEISKGNSKIESRRGPVK